MGKLRSQRVTKSSGATIRIQKTQSRQQRGQQKLSSEPPALPAARAKCTESAGLACRCCCPSRVLCPGSSAHDLWGTWGRTSHTVTGRVHQVQRRSGLPRVGEALRLAHSPGVCPRQPSLCALLKGLPRGFAHRLRERPVPPPHRWPWAWCRGLKACSFESG